MIGVWVGILRRPDSDLGAQMAENEHAWDKSGYRVEMDPDTDGAKEIAHCLWNPSRVAIVQMPGGERVFRYTHGHHEYAVSYQPMPTVAKTSAVAATLLPEVPPGADLETWTFRIAPRRPRAEQTTLERDKSPHSVPGRLNPPPAIAKDRGLEYVGDVSRLKEKLTSRAVSVSLEDIIRFGSAIIWKTEKKKGVPVRSDVGHILYSKNGVYVAVIVAKHQQHQVRVVDIVTIPPERDVYLIDRRRGSVRLSRLNALQHLAKHRTTAFVDTDWEGTLIKLRNVIDYPTFISRTVESDPSKERCAIMYLSNGSGLVLIAYDLALDRDIPTVRAFYDRQPELSQKYSRWERV